MTGDDINVPDLELIPHQFDHMFESFPGQCQISQNGSVKGFEPGVKIGQALGIQPIEQHSDRLVAESAEPRHIVRCSYETLPAESTGSRPMQPP